MGKTRKRTLQEYNTILPHGTHSPEMHKQKKTNAN